MNNDVINYSLQLYLSISILCHFVNLLYRMLPHYMQREIFNILETLLTSKVTLQIKISLTNHMIILKKIMHCYNRLYK